MSQVYACSQTSPLKLDAPHDPDAEEYYTMQYRAPAWIADRVYLEKTCGEIGDLVTPLSANGFLYECVSGGLSGSAEPIWPSTTDETVVDNTITWKAIPDAFNLLNHGETITGSDWMVDAAVDEDGNGVDYSAITLTDDGVAGGKTYVRVSGVPSTIYEFTLRNRITIQRTGALVEIIDRSLRIRVKEM